MVAYLFPGQGSQRPGMGRDLLERPWAVGIAERAEEAAGLPLREYILADPAALSSTAIVQPALLLVEWLAYEALRREGRMPRAAAGHSLGEFAALAACGVLNWREVLELGALRGRLMEEAASRQPGGMVALVKLPQREAERIAAAAGCWVANYNSPRQTVLSGPQKALERAAELAKEAGGRAIPLKVSGPFHSPALREAEAALERRLGKMEFRAPACVFVSSVSGRPESDPEVIRDLVSRQMSSPVRWTEVLHSLAELGIREAWEVGPGDVLSGLGKRTLTGIRFLTFKEVIGDGRGA